MSKHKAKKIMNNFDLIGKIGNIKYHNKNKNKNKNDK